MHSPQHRCLRIPCGFLGLLLKEFPSKQPAVFVPLLWRSPVLQKATRHVAMAVKAGRGQSKAAKSWHSREQAGSKLVVPVSWQGLDQSCAIFRSSCFSRKNLE